MWLQMWLQMWLPSDGDEPEVGREESTDVVTGVVTHLSESVGGRVAVNERSVLARVGRAPVSLAVDGDVSVRKAAAVISQPRRDAMCTSPRYYVKGG